MGTRLSQDERRAVARRIFANVITSLILPLSLPWVLPPEDQDDCVGFSTNRNAPAGNTCTVPRHGEHLAGAQEPAPLPFAHVDR